MGMLSDQQSMEMPLTEVVRVENGGNGLASDRFQIPLTFLNLFGWQNVDAGVEALVVDGQVVETTRLRAEIMRLIGKRAYMRRVMLNPPPLEVTAQALSNGEPPFAVSLTVLLKYRVQDAALVASEAGVLEKFRSVVRGILAQHIRTSDQADLLAVSSSFQMSLSIDIRNDKILLPLFTDIEILAITPQGDERVMEIARQLAAEQARAALIAAEGQNRVIDSGFTIKIEQEKALLLEQQKAAEHARTMQMAELQSQAATQQKLLEAIAQVAGAGVNPDVLIKAAGGMLGLTAQTDSAPRPPVRSLDAGAPATEDDRITRERAALTQAQADLGFTQFDIYQSGVQVTGAKVVFSDFTLFIQCPSGYPMSAPSGAARYVNGTQKVLSVSWFASPSSLLVHYVMGAIPQARSTSSIPPISGTSGTSSFDDLFEED